MMDQLNLALALIGGFVLGAGIFSNVLKRSPMQEPMLGVATGIIVGPQFLGLLDLTRWGEPHVVLELAARLTLAVGLMGVALRLDHDSLRRLWRPIALLLIVAMVGMCAISSSLALGTLGLSLWLAVAVGAVLTPTDPIVASAIVTGTFAEKRLPQRVRTSLSLESGANDGLAYLFVMLPVLFLGSDTGSPLAEWVINKLLRGVAAGVIVGVVIGWLAGSLLVWAKRRKLIETHSYLTFSVALSLFTLGVARLMGSDALLAVFVAGLVMSLTTDTREQHDEENIQEAVNKLFSLPIFVLFGAALPWAAWIQLGLPLAAFVASILLLRRLPIIMLLRLPPNAGFTAADRAYLGWFGPIGIAALYYAAVVVSETGEVAVWHIASAVILASVLVHGGTAAPFTLAYDRASRGKM